MALGDCQLRRMARAHLKRLCRDASRARVKLFRRRILMCRFWAGAFLRDCRREFTSRVMASNAADPVLVLVPENRRATLLAQPDTARSGSWIFEVRLRGEGETVFFDV